MATEAVLKFLEEQNRPFSLGDIENGVKGDFGKAAVKKAVEALVEKEMVKEKVYGKQKVFCIIQKTSIPPQELSDHVIALDRKINEIEANIKETTDKIKQNFAQYDSIRGKITLPQAVEKKLSLENELKLVKSELKEYAGVEPIKTEVKQKIEKNYEKYLETYKKRKRMCTDILDGIFENYPKTKKQLFSDIGIETDEEVGFKV